MAGGESTHTRVHCLESIFVLCICCVDTGFSYNGGPHTEQSITALTGAARLPGVPKPVARPPPISAIAAAATRHTCGQGFAVSGDVRSLSKPGMLFSFKIDAVYWSFASRVVPHRSLPPQPASHIRCTSSLPDTPSMGRTERREQLHRREFLKAPGILLKSKSLPRLMFAVELTSHTSSGHLL